MVSYSRHLGGLAVVATLALANSCETHLDPVDPSRVDAGTPKQDAAFDAGATLEEQCAAACSNMRDVTSREPCAGFEGQLSPEGASCETVCVDTERSTTARFCPVEMSQAATCAELQAAWESCE